MPRTKVNDIELYYELHGLAGTDVLVLSNGILMSTASWAYQLPVLARHVRVLLYDCRGMWQSDHPAGPYSMEQHADDLAGLLDVLQIPVAHIAGISYGGEVSLVFARRHPERARSLIVSSAVSTADAAMQATMIGWRAAAQARDPDLLFQATYPVNFSAGWIAAHAPALEAARARYAQLDFAALLQLIDAFCRLDLTAELGRIRVPTLVIVGERDALKPPRYSEIIARGIPNAEFVSVPEAGHAVSWEKPDAFNTLLLGFVMKHSAAGAPAGQRS